MREDDLPDVRALVPHGDWWIDLQWAVVNGRVEVVGVHVRAYSRDSDPWPLPVTKPVSTATLRTIPLAQLIADSRDDDAVLALLDHSSGDAPQQPEPAPAEPRRRGRPPTLGRDFYAEVARVYRWAHERQLPPTKTVAEHIFEEWETGPVDPSTAATWVSRARNQYQLLGPAIPGKPGEAQTQKDQP
jgi:hypothetical protein